MVWPRCLQFSPHGHSLTFSTCSLPWRMLCREGHQHPTTPIPSLHLQPSAASKLDFSSVKVAASAHQRESQSRSQSRQAPSHLGSLGFSLHPLPLLRSPVGPPFCVSAPCYPRQDAPGKPCPLQLHPTTSGRSPAAQAGSPGEPHFCTRCLAD